MPSESERILAINTEGAPQGSSAALSPLFPQPPRRGSLLQHPDLVGRPTVRALVWRGTVCSMTNTAPCMYVPYRSRPLKARNDMGVEIEPARRLWLHLHG
jgi:hypothetical protein